MKAAFRADFSTICQKHSPKVAWQQILNMTENAIRAVQTKHADIKPLALVSGFY